MIYAIGFVIACVFVCIMIAEKRRYDRMIALRMHRDEEYTQHKLYGEHTRR